MKKFILSTETTADLPEDFYKEHNILISRLSYTIDGETYKDGLGLDMETFYNKVKEGSMPVTSQVNPEEFIDIFKSELEKGNDILHLCLSSGISGTYQSALIARDELLDEYPDRRIIIIDSKSASMGVGLLIYYGTMAMKEGKSIEEVENYIKSLIPNMVHLFTVDDLSHLHRGGRVSKTTAIIGGALKIKPILNVNNEGKLSNIGKAMGRKKAISDMVNRMSSKINGFDNKMIMISHGACEEDAISLKEEVKKLTGLDCFMINHIGPVIGSHSGQGTLALFFLGNER